ncbi:cytochrome c oxidase subunit 3 [bacterium]|nr:cytochrome c oxidase subunit 3 [bacterium]
MLCLTLVGAFGFLGIKAVEYNHKWKHGLLWGQLYRPQEHAAEDAHAEPAAETAPAEDYALAAADGESVVQVTVDTEAPAADEPPVIPEGAPPTYIPRTADGELYIEHSTKPHAAEGPSGLAFTPTSKGHEPYYEKPGNVHIFFGVYFAMTGLHGLHVIAGIVVIIIMLVLAIRGHFDSGYFTPIDLTGLYWHLVDLIWIFLFPLLYLIH